MIETLRYCPVWDIACPYFRAPEFCALENPVEDCDEYIVFCNEETEMEQGH